MDIPEVLDYEHGHSIGTGDVLGGLPIVKRSHQGAILKLSLSGGRDVEYVLVNDDRPI